MTAAIVKPQNAVPLDTRKPILFLAGSIEMGKAEDWQARLSADLSDMDIVICNPRRDEWDSTWEQRADNPKFREQVLWELNALDLADVIAMNFIPGTMSPVSLLEFGLHARTTPMAVLCPEGFWRKGNVDVTAQLYDVPVFYDYDLWLRGIKIMLGRVK